MFVFIENVNGDLFIVECLGIQLNGFLSSGIEDYVELIYVCLEIFMILFIVEIIIYDFVFDVEGLCGDYGINVSVLYCFVYEVVSLLFNDISQMYNYILGVFVCDYIGVVFIYMFVVIGMFGDGSVSVQGYI